MPHTFGERSPLGLVPFFRDLDADSYKTLEAIGTAPPRVVKLGFFPLRVVLMLGREANGYMLSTNTEAFCWRGAMKVLMPVEGDKSLIVSDGDDHARRKKVVQPGFHKRRVDSYLEAMVDEADLVLDTLAVGDHVEAYDFMRTAIRRTAVRTLFGAHLRARADEIGELFQPALDFVNLEPIRQVKLPWPGTNYHAAKRARAGFVSIINEELARRRAIGDGHEGDDMLAMLLGTNAEAGSVLTDEEIQDQVVSLVASYDTTSAAMGWAVHRLATEPDVWERTRDELDRVLGEGPITVAHMPRLPYLEGVVNESLRLHPASVYSPRKVVKSFEFAGHKIRKGDMILYSPFISGRDPGSWSYPDVFRPERWDRTRADYAEPLAYSFVPFGGGTRRCIGFAFAQLQMKVLIAQLARRVELASLSTEPLRPTGATAVRPAGGVPMRVVAVRASSRAVASSAVVALP